MSEITAEHDEVTEDDNPLGNPYLGSLKHWAGLGLLGGALTALVGALMTGEEHGSATGPVVLMIGMTLLTWAGLAQIVFWVSAAVLWQRQR
ncbi:hypothetical protein [Kineococcus xinjiangensis]|nr:hypothetical protein [Kineococcus xinjiangensis]